MPIRVKPKNIGTRVKNAAVRVPRTAKDAARNINRSSENIQERRYDTSEQYAEAQVEQAGRRLAQTGQAAAQRTAKYRMVQGRDAFVRSFKKFNPARMVVPPAEEQYIAEFYYMDEIVELWMAAKGTIIEPAVFLTSLYGFRRGEICGLKMDKLIFRQRVIPIIEQRTTAGREVTKKTKTKASTRMMPMMEAVAQYINIIIEQQEERKAFLGGGYTDSGYLITNEFGKPLSLSRLDKAFSRLLEKKGMRHIRFHDLRHSIATNLLILGIPLQEVSAWLGHSSVATTEKVYAHITIAMRQRAAKVLDKLMGFERKEAEKPKTSRKRSRSYSNFGQYAAQTSTMRTSYGKSRSNPRSNPRIIFRLCKRQE